MAAISLKQNAVVVSETNVAWTNSSGLAGIALGSVYFCFGWLKVVRGCSLVGTGRPGEQLGPMVGFE